MSEPYLILHRVRGQPAFDIAERIEVEATEGVFEDWWIIPTSGHRAYPYWTHAIEVDDFEDGSKSLVVDSGSNMAIFNTPSMPDPWPDHYPTTSSPHIPDPTASSLAERLGLVPKAPPIPPITRRL